MLCLLIVRSGTSLCLYLFDLPTHRNTYTVPSCSIHLLQSVADTCYWAEW